MFKPTKEQMEEQARIARQATGLSDDTKGAPGTYEGLLRLGKMPRLHNESTVDYLRRQKTAILMARAQDENGRDDWEANKLRDEIRALGHEPVA